MSNHAPPVYGLLAEFDTVDGLLTAARRVREAGYKKWDTFTPFPVHGLDRAMGIRRTILPWLVLGGGLTGLAAGLGLQWWTNAYIYPFLISGKPIFSLPANIPIIFEMTILFSALTAFFGVLMLNRLPELYHPVFNSERFKRVTSDRFFLAIESSEPGFHKPTIEKLLTGAGAQSVEVVEDLDQRPAIPGMIVTVAVVLMALGLIPFALIAKARMTTSDQVRLHLVPDMDFQQKYLPQAASAFFADGRAMRPPVEGTVAFGDLKEDDPLFYFGLDDINDPTSYTKTYPARIRRNASASMDRGQDRYNIYCALCHGVSGYGNGIVPQRALARGQGWQVASLHLKGDESPERADTFTRPGYTFHVISNGIRTMPSYAAQIPEDDRWAIALYVDALRRSQRGNISDVPAHIRPGIK